MEAQCDIILQFLSDDGNLIHQFSAIAAALQRANLHPPTSCMNYLTDHGFIERMYGKDALYRITDKGKDFHRQGGFSRATVMKRERRIARICTLCALGINIALVSVFYFLS